MDITPIENRPIIIVGETISLTSNLLFLLLNLKRKTAWKEMGRISNCIEKHILPLCTISFKNGKSCHLGFLKLIFLAKWLSHGGMGKFNAKCPRLKAFNHLQIIKITSKYHIDKSARYFLPTWLRWQNPYRLGW